MAGDGGHDAKAIQERGQELLASDHFGVLGVSRSATPADVQTAFLEAVKTWHPDRIPAGLEVMQPLYAQVFARLEVARSTLADASRRLRYVEELTRPTKRATAGDLSTAEANLELKKAEALLKKNDVGQAEAHLRRAVQLSPSNVDAQALLLSLLAKPTSSPEELRKLLGDLDRLVGRSPSCVRAYFFRGQIRKRLGMNDEAHADFERASDLDPSNIDAAREVRIYQMRKDRAPAARAPASQPPEGGVGGFFKKLFKR